MSGSTRLSPYTRRRIHWTATWLEDRAWDQNRKHSTLVSARARTCCDLGADLRSHRRRGGPGCWAGARSWTMSAGAGGPGAARARHDVPPSAKAAAADLRYRPSRSVMPRLAARPYVPGMRDLTGALGFSMSRPSSASSCYSSPPPSTWGTGRFNPCRDKMTARCLTKCRRN